MNLKEYKEMNCLSLDDMQELFEIDRSKLYRICQDGGCIKLAVATKIVKVTRGLVDYADLTLEGDC